MTLVGWWRLDGNAEDSSGFGNDGIQQGSVSFSEGKIGGALSLTSSDGGLELLRSDGFREFRSHGTVSLWFRSESTSGGSVDRIVARDASEHPTLTINQGASSGDQNLRYYVDSTYSDFFDAETNTWYHVVLTWSTEDERITAWVDGEKQLETTVSSVSSDASRPMVVGGNTEGDGDISGNDFTGRIDDVRLYDRVLSAKEIKGLSRSKVLHYRFNRIRPRELNGMPVDIAANDLTFYGDQWGGSSNKGEIDLEGSYFESLDGTSHDIRPINKGVATQDSGSGTFYIMYSEESVHSRFSDNPPHTDNCDHLILVDYISGQWNYDDNNSFHSFDKRPSDRIIGEVSKDTGNIQSVDKLADSKVGDSSGYGNNAILDSDAPSWTRDSPIGSGAYDFSGDKERLETSTELRLGSSEWTVCSWYYPQASDDYGHILADPTQDDFTCKVSKDLVPYFFSQQDRTRVEDFTGSLTEGEWQHLAYVYDGGSVRIYLNGEKRADVGVSGLDIPSNKLRVQGGNGEYVAAKHDDVRLYKTALSQAGIEKVYRQRASLDDRGNFHSHELSEDVSEGLNLEAESAGYDSGNYSKLKVNGDDIGAKGRGINALEVDRMGNKIKTENFDVYANPTTETQNLIDFVDNAENGNLLMFGEDDHAGNIESNGVSKLQSLGSRYIDNVAAADRTSWSFICIKGRGRLAEEFAPNGEGPVTASETLPDDLNIKTTGTLESEFNETGPAADSLIGYWKLDGDPRDYSGNENHGTNNGATVTSGLGQSAYSFDGTDDNLLIEDSEAFKVDDITVSVWVNLNGIQSGYAGIIDKVYNDSFAWYQDSGDQEVNWYITNINGDIPSLRDISIPKGDWVHLTGTYSSSTGTLKAYRNGEKVREETVGAYPLQNSSNDIRIGKRIQTGEIWNGKIQDVRVFNKALSGEEIKMIYNLSDPRQKQKVVQSPSGELFTSGEFDETL